MGRAWCESCRSYVEAGGKIFFEEEACKIKGVEFKCKNLYYRCPVCGEPVMDNWLCDLDTEIAHWAYIRARDEKV